MKSSNRSLGTFLSFGAIVLMVVTVFLVPRLLNKFTKLPPIAPRAAGTNASLALPVSSPIASTQDVSVPIIVNTDTNQIIGVDVMINFDRSVLTLVDINPVAATATTLKTFVPCVKDASGDCPTGTFDKQTVINNANGNGTGTGLIQFGASTFNWSTQTVTNPYVGITTLAILTFAPKKVEQTTVSFVFSPGNTTDSNMVPTPSNASTDILASVTNLTFTVTTPTPTSPATPTPGGCATRQYGDLEGGGVEGGCDGDVDIFDFNILYKYFSRTNVCGTPAGVADINPLPDGDCQVNIFDFNELYKWFSRSLP